MNLNSSHHQHSGLTSQEAERLLALHGPNDLIGDNRLSHLHEFFRILSDPMGLMMLGLAILYFFTGDKMDAGIMLIAYIPVTAVDVFLELRSEKALKALRTSLQRTAKVFRDGFLKDIEIEKIVPGDVLAFEEGQHLPADGKVIESQNLNVSESALTGESIPIEKSLNSDFFAGTSVLSGRGLGRIELTGSKTKFGKISSLLNETAAESSPLQKKVGALVKRITLFAAFLVLSLFFLEWFRGNGILSSLITALTFGMAAVPEEFPLVFTLYLSLGSWRLSKHGVLVKTLPSVEALGNVDVICTDKTGTLTEGQFQLVEIRPFGQCSPEQRSLVARLACEPQPIDAMEIAISQRLGNFPSLLEKWQLIHDYPFENQGKHMTHIWQDQRGHSVLAMKGAPEGVLEHCHVSSDDRETILATIHDLARQGHRLLGLAMGEGPFTGQRNSDEKSLQFIGILIFSDPVRKSAKEAIQICQESGIEIKMLTGDHSLTAHAIADELNIAHSEKSIFSGSELANMKSNEKTEAFLKGTIFARVSPEQKFELIQSLKNAGKVVAMTGDGVNDSPALKLADIGISMGLNATDVARSTAKMILLKNDFNGIVQAVLEGRNIFANLRRSFSYLIAFHIPVVLLALLPPLLDWQKILLPVHIILLELIVHPISAFAFENLKSRQLQNEKNLVPLLTAVTASLSGLLLTALSLLPFFYFQNVELTNDSSNNFSFIRSYVLSIVLFGNIGFTFLDAWPQIKGPRILTISAVLLILPILLCNVDILSQYLHLQELGALDFLMALGAGLLAAVPAFIIRISKK